VREDKVVDFLGNYFKPSAVVAACRGSTDDNGLKGFCSTLPMSWPALIPCSIEQLGPRFAFLRAEVKTHPRAGSLFKKVKLQDRPIPSGYDFLLTADFYGKLRLFSKEVSVQVKRHCYKFSVSIAGSLLLGKLSCSGSTTPPLPKSLHDALKALNLDNGTVLHVTWHNRLSVPDPSGLLPEMACCHGEEFSFKLVELVSRSYSLGANCKSALLLVREGSEPRFFRSFRRVRNLFVVISTRLEVRLYLSAANHLDVFSLGGYTACKDVELQLRKCENFVRSHKGTSATCDHTVEPQHLRSSAEVALFTLTVELNGMLSTLVASPDVAVSFEYDGLRLFASIMQLSVSPSLDNVLSNALDVDFAPRSVAHSLRVHVRKVNLSLPAHAFLFLNIQSTNLVDAFKVTHDFAAFLELLNNPGTIASVDCIVCGSHLDLAQMFLVLCPGITLSHTFHHSSQVTLGDSSFTTRSQSSIVTHHANNAHTDNPLTHITLVISTPNAVVTIHLSLLQVKNIGSVESALRRFADSDHVS